MIHRKDLVIVLKSVRYQERDRIVTGLTAANGKIVAIAKNGIHSRRFGGGLEPFAAGDWDFTIKNEGSEMAQLRQVSVRHSYEKLRANFDHLSLASFFNELVLKVVTPTPSGASSQNPTDLFRLHTNALKVLENPPEGHSDGFMERIANQYLFKLLTWCGVPPQLASCQKCQKPITEIVTASDSVTASVEHAHWICLPCSSSSSAPEKSTMIPVTTTALMEILLGQHQSIRQAVEEISQRPLTTPKEQISLFEYFFKLLIYHVPGFDHPWSGIKSLRFLPFGDPKASWRHPPENSR